MYKNNLINIIGNGRLIIARYAGWGIIGRVIMPPLGAGVINPGSWVKS